MSNLNRRQDFFCSNLATDPTLTEGSLAQISIDGIPKQGVIRWIGYDDSRNEKLAGLEMVVSLTLKFIFSSDHEVFSSIYIVFEMSIFCVF